MQLNPFKRRGAQNTAVLDDAAADLFRSFWGNYATSTGVSVTSDSAVASVAVLACLIVRAESVMLCPVDVYRKEGRNRINADDHPVQRLIADQPNPLMTAEEFWRWEQITEDLNGNAYARIEWQRGRPVAIWPMTGPKPQVLIGKNLMGEQTLVYRYQGDDITPAGDYVANDVMHFKGPLLSGNPYEARSLVEVTAENIGLGIATEQFFGRFLGNGNHFPLYAETEQALSAKDFEALKKQFDDGSGLLSAGKTRIFDRGLKVKQNQMSLKDADLSSHQRWILEQVARTWRVPLPMIQDLTHGTYTNSEQADLWLAKYTATPIVRNKEGVIRRSLFIPSERGVYYSKFNVNAMMRGDFTARTAGYSVLINCGVLSPNEARAFEDWNPYEGGDQYRLPMNTEPAAINNAATAEVSARINAVGSLVRAGFDPTQSAAYLGIDGIEYLNVQPITIRDNELEQQKVDAQTATVESNTANALASLLGDAKARIEARHQQNAERGRSEADSLEFARIVLAPIVDAARQLGVEMDVDVVAEAIVRGVA